MHNFDSWIHRFLRRAEDWYHEHDPLWNFYVWCRFESKHCMKVLLLGIYGLRWTLLGDPELLTYFFGPDKGYAYVSHFWVVLCRLAGHPFPAPHHPTGENSEPNYVCDFCGEPRFC